MNVKRWIKNLSGFRFFTKGTDQMLFSVKKGKECRPVLSLVDLWNAWFHTKPDSFFMMPKAVANHLVNELGGFYKWRAFDGNSWFIVFSDESSYVWKVGKTDFATSAIRTNMESLNQLNKAHLPKAISIPKILGWGEMEGWTMLKESKIDISGGGVMEEEMLLKTTADFHREMSKTVELNLDLINHMIHVEPNLNMPSFILAKLTGILARLEAKLIGREVCLTRIHGDYWKGNVYKTTKGGLGLIDFDRSIDRSFAEFDLINYYFFRELSKMGNTGHNWEELLTSLVADSKRFQDLQDFIKKYYQYHPGTIQMNEPVLYTIIQLYILRICIINFKLLGYSPDGIKYLIRVKRILNSIKNIEESQAQGVRYKEISF